MKRFSLMLMVLVLASSTLLADGKVVAPPPVVDHWKISNLMFPLLSGRQVNIEVAFIRNNGVVDHTEQITISGSDYRPFLLALSTPLGAIEGTVTTEVVQLDSEGNVVYDAEGKEVLVTVPDLAAILNLRISAWLVSNGKLENVTAEPVTAE